ARKLAHEVILVDTHIDVPERLRGRWEDISQRTKDGNFDYPRARQGGLHAPFMSIYTPSDEEAKGTSYASANELIALVERFAREWPDKFALATSPADVRAQFLAGKLSLCMGMENGSPIAGKIDNVRYFYDKGVRYITLAHAKDNHLSDSSYDTKHTWHGLSPF